MKMCLSSIVHSSNFQLICIVITWEISKNYGSPDFAKNPHSLDLGGIQAITLFLKFPSVLMCNHVEKCWLRFVGRCDYQYIYKIAKVVKEWIGTDPQKEIQSKNNWVGNSDSKYFKFEYKSSLNYQTAPKDFNVLKRGHEVETKTNTLFHQMFNNFPVRTQSITKRTKWCLDEKTMIFSMNF